MISNEELFRIMERISDTTATEPEIRKFNTWCDSFKEVEKELPHLEQIQERILTQLHQRIASGARNVVPLFFKRIVGIAATIAAIVLGLWFFKPAVLHTGTEALVLKNDIGPGGNKAMLKVAGNRVVQLSEARTGVIVKDGRTAYSDGSAVEDGVLPSGDDVQQMELSTPRGGTYQITLPDGSRVVLNAASRIAFPSKFSGRQRKIQLEGEAYFEVAKNKHNPFIVQTAGQQVEVLGTHFNLHAYRDEASVSTTLLEGRVRVSSLAAIGGQEDKTTTVLNPGEQAVSADGGFKIRKVDTEEAVAWKNGYFRFNNENIESVMLKLSRWYNIEVHYEGRIPDEEFSGAASRSKTIGQVLEMLQYSKSVHFKVEGRRVTVTN
ncbi:transmembrane sensor [Pedobacter africanus]|uniref:Ferric-dicitrate binding protein FerR (Iron transport regulator) n=1 Tax=Pedobacter africanus TaxID=151894 RepID=A0ACC6L0M7_9SPHI|nr:FecR domain-containing protein [Pedobacter africanus]MDR6785154.1 ferric-dicitrate binding protein FerR (iron transport regulator) [Pedobacter africanus]